MLTPGEQVELSIERPASGGAMIARHDGQIVLVSGAIPGERVAARISRVERRLAFAVATEVIDPSPDRRAAAGDPLCGGCLYAHIAIERQRAIKAEVVADAFARIGRHRLSAEVQVAASPDRGYRMRARLHVRDGRFGFFREGSHELCDAAGTGQLTPASLSAAAAVVAALERAGAPPSSLEIAENVPNDQRAIFVQLSAPGRLSGADLDAFIGPDLASISTSSPSGARVSAGAPAVSDVLATITEGRATGQLRRTAESFFQANRFLLPALAVTVLDAVLPEGDVLDLYSGVGLFAASLAGSGRSGITAVEGPGSSGADLRLNAAAFPSQLTAVVAPVERYLARAGVLPPTVIVDPPRTGLSKEVTGRQKVAE